MIRRRSIHRHSLLIALGAVAAFTVHPAESMAQQAQTRHAAAQSADLGALLAQQAERIDRLEALLDQLLRGQAEGTGLESPCGLPDGAPSGWQSEAAWSRITIGMSEARVTAILGRPTRVQPGAAHRTLVYEDVLQDGQLLRGTVHMGEGDSVERVRRPVRRP